jgi:hypothetical protein
MAATRQSSTEGERAARRARFARAVASVRLEGLEPSRAAEAVFARYVSGELTVEEMTAEIRALNARDFRPIHLAAD